MAEAQIEQVLEREVTCPLCLEIFKEPKKLPCDHVYCKECLIKLSQCCIDGIIPCPECRSPIPCNDVLKFPTAFQMNRLIETFQRVHVSTSSSPSFDVDDAKMCIDHSTQSLVIYCETCKKQLCRDCVLKSKDHVTHRYGFFDEVAQKYRTKVVNIVSLVKHQKVLLSDSLTENAFQKESVKTHAEKCQNDIDQAFEGLMSVVEECKSTLKSEAAAHYDSLTRILEQQSQQLEEVVSELAKLTTSACTQVQYDDQSFLLNIESIVTNLSKLEKQYKPIPLAVPKPQLLTTQLISTEVLRHFMKATCGLYNRANPKMCSIQGIFTKVEFEENVDNNLLLNLRDLKGNMCQGGNHTIEADLVNESVSLVKGNVENVSPGRVKITVRPKTRGKYKLSVLVNNDHILNSPFSAIVSVPPKSLSKPIATVTGLKRPSSLVYFEDKVLVTETKGNRIIAIDAQQHDIVQEFRTLLGVQRLALDANQNIYVTITDDHKLHKLTKVGNKVKTIGQLGTQNTEFNCPSGLRVSEHLELFVCDSNNGRIQVFDLDLNFRRVFGKKENGKKWLKFPSDIDFDSSGNSYIVDSVNNCVQVFSSEEEHVFTIGNQRNCVRFNRPVGLVVHSHHIYVTNTFKHDVVVLDLNGELITFFGEGHLSWPEGITVDKDGYIYVTSLRSVVIF